MASTLSGSTAIKTTTIKTLQYGQPGWHFFWISAELLLLVAFLTGFYAIVHKNDDSDYQQQFLHGDDSETVRDGALRSIILSNNEARVCGYIAMACTSVAFIMVTLVSRFMHIPTP